MSEQVIIEFIADTSQLAPAVDKLTALGVIDEKSAAIFKATNDQIKQRNTLLQTTLSSTESLTTNTEDQQAVYNKLVASVKNLSGASKDAVISLLKLSKEDVAKTIKATGNSVDQFVTSLELGTQGVNNFGKNTTGLRAQLRQLTNELAAMADAGIKDGPAFDSLALQAGKLKNALQTTTQTVSSLASEVPALKVFEVGLRGITGGFTAATGAAALFDQDNKDLQEVLVRVNAVMAINAGISEILNVVRDESAIATARAIVAERVYNAQIAIDNGLQSESVVIRGAATVAQYALNLAMSLNPIGAVVIAIAGFITAIALYTSAATKAAKETADLNAAIARTGDAFEAELTGIQDVSKKILAELDERSARQSESLQEDLSILKINNAARAKAIDDLNATILRNQTSTDKDVLEQVTAARARLLKLQQDQESARFEIAAKGAELRKQLETESLQDQASLIQASLSLSTKNSTQNFALQRQLAVANSALAIKEAGDDAQKVKEIQAGLYRELRDIQIAQAKVAQDTIAASLETSLIKSQNASRAINDRLSQEEIDAQKKIILERAAFDIKQEGLSAQEKANIQAKANQQALELQRNFNIQSNIEAIQDQISGNNKVLDQINISEKKKLDLKITNIIDAAAIEIEQNRGKVAKIQEIESKRDSDIKSARLASIQDTLDKELQLTAAQNAGVIRQLENVLDQQAELRNDKDYFSEKALEKRLGIQKLDLNSQIAIIDQITNFALAEDQKKEDSLENQLAQGLISQKDFNIEYQKLIDAQAKTVEDGEKKKQGLIKDTVEKQKATQKQIIDFAIAQAQAAINVLQSIYQQDGQAAQDRIDSQRKSIQDLSDAGQISAKEASARNKALDVEQAQLQHKQAVRDKQIALFNAIISGAQAVVQALVLGPIYAAIVGAIAATEIAVIASRPIPQFKTGKKNRYEGPGEIGEAGTEILERNGRMYVVNKPTITWLAASDKVYNPKETAAIIEGRVPVSYSPGQTTSSQKSLNIDYDRFGKAVGENITERGVGFDVMGMYQWEKRGNSFKKYLTNRRKWG